jgi:hypothetical protein
LMLAIAFSIVGMDFGQRIVFSKKLKVMLH